MTNKTIAQLLASTGWDYADIVQLLKITKIAWNKDCAKSLIAVTQQGWLRPEGKEKWQVTEIYEDKRVELLPVFRRMGLVDSLLAVRSGYAHTLFMAGHVERMILRRKVFFELQKQGVSWGNVVFLASDRPLITAEKKVLITAGWDPIPDTEAALYPRFFTEMVAVDGAIGCISATGCYMANGQFRRANTADTVIEWLKTNPLPGPTLLISSQPLCLHQKLVAQTYLEGWDVDVVGLQAPTTTPIGLYLDTIARILYQAMR